MQLKSGLLSSPLRSLLRRLTSSGLVGLGLTGLCLFAGCNTRDPNLPEVARVEGVVMFKGKPLPEGEVHLHPEDTNSNPGIGMIEKDGTFQLSTYERHDGATVGKHKVTIIIQPHLDGSIPDPPIQIPKQYGNPKSTPLNIEIEGGKTNKLELTIK